MKMNYCISPVAPVTLIILLISLSLITYSQDLTEAQRQERCQNNKTRIAELESQIREIKADLSMSMTKKEMEDAEEQLRLLRLMKNESDYNNSDNWRQLQRIMAQYNFDFNKCLYETNNGMGDTFSKCYKIFENVIVQRINKGFALQNKKTGLVNKKTELDKQLASHRNNLIALRCGETVGNTNGTCTLAGKWVHDTEGIGTTTWTITSVGIATEEGKGYAKGKATFDGTTLSIDWKTTNGYSGTYSWKLNSNCISYEGTLVFTTPITGTHKSSVKKIL